jgi:Fungal Zn(2)-Cys(6) binuclear cluster domain
MILTQAQCDETIPACRNCVKKGARCSFLDNPASESRSSSRLELQRPLPQADFCDSLSPDVNMFQMKLFHHFGTTTANTLVFGVSIWRNTIMALSFQACFPAYHVLPQPQLTTSNIYIARFPYACYSTRLRNPPILPGPCKYN